MLAALLEVAVGVEARAGGNQQHDLAGARVGRGRGDRGGQILAAADLDPGTTGRPSSRSIRSAASPIRYAAAQRSATGSASPSKSPPLSEPPRIARTPPSNERSAAAAAATLVAFESFT